MTYVNHQGQRKPMTNFMLDFYDANNGKVIFVPCTDYNNVFDRHDIAGGKFIEGTLKDGHVHVPNIKKPVGWLRPVKFYQFKNVFKDIIRVFGFDIATVIYEFSDDIDVGDRIVSRRGHVGKDFFVEESKNIQKSVGLLNHVKILIRPADIFDESVLYDSEGEVLCARASE